MKPDEVIPWGMVRCTACRKDRPSTWTVGAGNIANPPRGPTCECGCTQFEMTIGQSPPDLSRDEILALVRPFVYLNGSHELPNYIGIWNAAVAWARAQIGRGA